MSEDDVGSPEFLLEFIDKASATGAESIVVTPTALSKLQTLMEKFHFVEGKLSKEMTLDNLKPEFASSYPDVDWIGKYKGMWIGVRKP